MNLSVNGQSQVPPGFRFHPTEEELLHYYLRKKVAYKKIDLDVIRDVDLNKLEPWDIQEKCKIGSSTPQSDWYFFSHKDKKYPTGTRTNRATTAGFWKATGRDKVIYSSLRRIGMRKTLVFYKGRAPHGQKSDWIMHEYRLELDDTFTTHHDADKANNLAAAGGGGGGDYSVSEEGWVVCRVFKKKNYHRALEIASPQRQRQSPSTSSMNMDHSRNQLMVMRNSSNDGGIADQILQYMGRPCKQEENEKTTTTSNNSNINMPSSSLINIINTVHLPSLEESDTPTILPSSSSSSSLNNKYCYSSPSFFNHHHEEEGRTTTTTTTTTAAAFKDYGGGGQSMDPLNHHHQKDGVINDWAAFDRLVASQLNGPGSEQDAKVDTSNHLSSCYNYGYRYGDPNVDFCFSIDGHDHDDVVQLSQLPSSSRPNIQPSSSQVQNTEIDLWSFTRSLSSSSSCSDPLCHLSV